jgi:hypothetical protein
MIFFDHVMGSLAESQMTFRKTAMWILRVLLTGLMLIVSGGFVRATCINVNQTETLTFEGTLTFHIFGGPPYNGGVRLGDTPEPTYILKLDDATCAIGDDSVDPNNPIDRIQVFPEYSATENRELSNDLRRLVGRRVRVRGRSRFGAQTGHHHAPLLLPISQIEDASDPTAAYGTAMTTVQAFYLALAAGNGDEAASFVVPEKRVRGPLSANAITGFYRDLKEPLTLIDVVPLGTTEYRVRYTFVDRATRCDGVAIVETTRLRGENLIASIKALNGC